MLALAGVALARVAVPALVRGERRRRLAHRLGGARRDRRDPRPVAACAISVTVATTVMRVAAVPIALDAIATLFGLVALVLVLIRVLDLPDGAAGREAGLWVALAGAAGIFVARRPLDARRAPVARRAATPTPPGGPYPSRRRSSRCPRRRRAPRRDARARARAHRGVRGGGRVLLTDVGGTLPVSVLSTPGMIGVMERCAADARLRAARRRARHRGLRGLHQARGRRRARAPTAPSRRGSARSWTSASCASTWRCARATAPLGVGTHERRIIQQAGFGG